MRPLRERSIRSVIITLTAVAAALLAAGALADWWWLIGLGAWALAAAGLLEALYRP